MANQIIRPDDLPPRANPVASEVVPSDNGSIVAGVTWADGVNAGRPLASQNEAEAGVNATKAMTPLTTKQAIEAQAITGLTAGENVTISGPANNPVIDATAELNSGDKGDVSVITPTSEWRINRQFDTVAALLADDGSGPTGMGYAGSGASVTVAAGDIVTAGGFRYEVAASNAPESWLVENDNGVKMSPLPLQSGGASIIQFGGGTGNPVTDGTALEKLVAYVAASGITGDVILAPGDYTLSKGLSLPKGCRWICPEVARLDFSGVASSDLPYTQGIYRGCVVGNGTRSAIPDLAADVAKGDRVFEFISAHGLVAGQVFDIYDPTDFSFSPGNAIFRNGQRFRVMHVIDSTHVQADEASDFDFAAAVVECYKHDSWSGEIEGIDVVGNGDTVAYVIGIAVDYAADVSLKRVSVSGGISYMGMAIGRSIDVDVERCRVTEDGIASSGNDYGYGNLSSRRVNVARCQFAGARHGVTHGTISGDLPFAKTTFRDCSDASLSLPAEAASWDYHGGGYDTYVENCTFSNGLILSGKGPAKFVDCTIHNVKPYGFCVIASQPAGGLYEFIRPKLVIRNKTSGTVSAFHLGAGSAAAFACLTEDATYRIRDIDVDGDIAGQPYIVGIGTDNDTYKVNSDIEGVTDNNVTSRVAVLTCFRHTNTPIAADFIRVTGVRKLVNGGEYARWSATYPNPARYAFDDQGGVSSVTVPSGGPSGALSVSYRHKYPTQLPIQAIAGVNNPGNMDGNFISARCLSVTYQSMSLSVINTSDNDNFTTGGSVTASWCVGCNN